MSNISETDVFNIKFQVKPFMNFIWFSVLLLSLGGILNFLKEIKMKKINYIIISILFSAIFIILYSSLGNEKIYDTEDLVGKKIPEVEINLFQSNGLLNTKEFTNNEFTILNFWASWCAPCRKEHPNLVRLSKIKNLKIVGVNFKDESGNAKSFLKKMAILLIFC